MGQVAAPAGRGILLVVLADALRLRPGMGPRAGLQPRLPGAALGLVFPVGPPRSHARRLRGPGLVGPSPGGDQRGPAGGGGLVLLRFPRRLVGPVLDRRGRLVVPGQGHVVVEHFPRCSSCCSCSAALPGRVVAQPAVANHLHATELLRLADARPTGLGRRAHHLPRAIVWRSSRPARACGSSWASGPWRSPTW